MDNAAVEEDVDELLRSINDGLRKAEEVMSAILEGMATDGAMLLAELEAALSDAEAALLGD